MENRLVVKGKPGVKDSSLWEGHGFGYSRNMRDSYADEMFCVLSVSMSIYLL